ncbi:hypothetical protein B0O99DRAFT_509108, partial [Bisporella sp. PMI_857]
VKSLMKTFQDAMYVAMKPGFCYIWIDSLCIVQDSKSDWTREALKMRTVDSNSDLNIAATSAHDGR